MGKMIHDILKENSRTSLNTVLLKVKAVHTFQMLRTVLPSSHFTSQRPESWYSAVETSKLEQKISFISLGNKICSWVSKFNKKLFCILVSIHK